MSCYELDMGWNIFFISCITTLPAGRQVSNVVAPAPMNIRVEPHLYDINTDEHMISRCLNVSR
jgi:hypothetical protein